MPSRILLYVMLVGLLLVGPASQAQPDCPTEADYVRAGRLRHGAGDYAGAIALYNCAEAAGVRSLRLYLLRGNSHRLARQYQAAIADYTRGLREDAENYFLLNNRGWTYYLIGEYGLAEQDLRLAIRQLPEYAYAYNNLGLTLIAQGRREEGLQQIVVAAGQTSPGSDDARANLRRIGYTGAIPDLTEVPEEAVATEDIAPEVAEVPAEAELSFEALRELARAASGQEALDLYTRLIAREPTDSILYIDRGNVYFALQDYAAAVADFDRALAFAPWDESALGNRGNSYYMLQDYARAFADFTELLERNPNNGFALHRFRESGIYVDPDRVQAYYEERLAANPGDLPARREYANLFRDRGNLSFAEQDYAAALADFERALALEPEDNTLLGDRGNTYYVLRDYERAFADFAQVLERDPDNEFALYRLRDAGVRFNPAAVQTYYEERLAANPDDVEVRRQYANLFNDLGQREYAYTLFEAIYAQDTSDAWSAYSLGTMAYQMGQYEDARAYYSAAVELEPNQLCYQLALADVLVRLDDLDAARDRYQSVAERADRNCQRTDLAHAYVGLGEIAVLDDALDEAAAYFQQAREIDDTNVRAVTGLAQLALDAGDDPAALTLIDRALTTISLPAAYPILRQRAEALRLLGQSSEMSEAFLLLGVTSLTDLNARPFPPVRQSAQTVDPTTGEPFTIRLTRGEIAELRFTLEAEPPFSAAVSVQVRDTGAGRYPADPLLILLDNFQTPLAADDNSGGGFGDALLTAYPLSEGGTYTLLVALAAERGADSAELEVTITPLYGAFQRSESAGGDD